MKIIISVWLEPPRKLREKINRTIETISKKYKVYGQMYEYKGPHITIFSLECEKSILPDILYNINSLLKNVRAFEVSINNTGYFLRPYTIIYLRVIKTKKLIDLYNLLNKNFKKDKIGYPKFTPHLTIANNKLNPEIDRIKLSLALKECKNLKFYGKFMAREIKISIYSKNSQRIKPSNFSIRTINLKD